MYGLGLALGIIYCAVLSHFSHVQLFHTLWTVACKAPQSMEFSRQEYWSGLPCSHPGIKFTSFSSALAGRFSTTSTILEELYNSY